MDELYIVICRDDGEEGQPGPYVLATRRVFGDRDSATAYTGTVAASREPIVVAGRWHELRIAGTN